MGFTYVAFEGYEVIAQAGDEAIDPRRNLPKAMIYSVCIVTTIYILVALQLSFRLRPAHKASKVPRGNGSAVFMKRALVKPFPA